MGFIEKNDVALSNVISHIIIRNIVMDEEKLIVHKLILIILDPYKRDITS